MSQTRQISKAIRSTLILWFLTAFIYPFFMISSGQILFPYQANGSLITKNNTVLGSALIGQPFTQEKYFWGRPSAVDYSTKTEILTTGTSGASNLAPSNPDLQKRIQKETARLKQFRVTATADLVYTSASGLDPHISVAAAEAQIQRVAKSRNLDPNQIKILVKQNIDNRFLGIFGEPGVNVLKLNVALDG
ncbi:potassium-transporting ATPase subunit C [Calothrix sp. NIES-4101]|nr:potassium-transporting ATPase subunit C [Calothrix sp. NIES-4101]